jgi:hypothetical protein
MPAEGSDPVDLAVEFTRVVPASGNLAVCGQQFWLGTHRAGLTITLRADAGTVELLAAGVRIKKVPSRLMPRHLRQLIAEGGTPIRPAAKPARPGTGDVIEIVLTNTKARSQILPGSGPVACARPRGLEPLTF